MKCSHLSLVLSVAACLVFCASGAAYESHRSVDVEFTDWDVSGGLAGAETSIVLRARAWLRLEGYEGEGMAIAVYDRTTYITDYDPNVDPELSAYCDCLSASLCTASGITPGDNYAMNAYAWALINNELASSTHAYIEYPDNADYYSDEVTDTIDVSYTGASITLRDLGYVSGYIGDSLDGVTIYAWGQSSSYITLNEL